MSTTGLTTYPEADPVTVKAVKKKRKVLLMYISKVSGHRQATVALQHALRKLGDDIEVPSINGFGYTFPRLEQIVNRAYMSVIHKSPQIWESMYDNPKFAQKSSFIKSFLLRASRRKMAKLFEEFQPDTVVCTQAFPCAMVAHYKMKKRLNTRIFAVLTDFAPHSYWINDGVDHYIVPSEECRDTFIERGVAAEKIHVLGIPVRGRFAVPADKVKVAEKLGLRTDVPTVLLMGGGQGLGPIKEAVASLLDLKTRLQMIVIAGTNKDLLSWLQGLPAREDKKIVHFEYASNVEELMDLASLIISKPGGLTVSESLAKGLPMVIINPIPGQEMRNTTFLVRIGAAVRVDRMADIGLEVDRLLTDPGRLAAMRAAAATHGRPHSAADIARLILDNPPA